MATFIREITTARGDVLRVGLVSEKKFLSAETIEMIGDMDVMGVELSRVSGNATIGHEALQSIEEYIASVFSGSDNLILFYFCDFINPIPRTSKTNIPPQEYRSRLFERMFERYVRLHDISDIHLSVITTEGIDETFYFHLIYRDAHARLADIINHDIKDGYGK